MLNITLKKNLYILFVLLLATKMSFAQLGGRSTMQFLSLASSARQEALGGYFIPFNDLDLSLAYQNPASLKPEMHNMLSVNSVLYPGNIKHGLLSYARDYDSLGTISYGVQFVNYGSELRTDETGFIDGKWYANEFAYYAGIGRKYNENIRYGMNVKLVTSFLEEYRAIAFATDLSAIYDKNDLVASIAVRNLGYVIKPYVDGNREYLPLDISLGLSNKLEHLPLTVFTTFHNLQKFNIRYGIDDSTSSNSWESSTTDTTTSSSPQVKKYTADKALRHLVVGGELSFGKFLKFRIAYNYLRRQEMKLIDKSGTVGFSWGVGLYMNKFQVSYARSNFSYAGSPNNFTLNFNLKSKVEKSRGSSEVQVKEPKKKRNKKGSNKIKDI